MHGFSEVTTSFEPDRFEVRERPRVLAQHHPYRARELLGLPPVSVHGHHAFGKGPEVLQVSHELCPVRVAGEALHGLHAHVYVERLHLAVVAEYRELLHASLDLAAQRQGALVAHEQQGVLRVVGHELEVLVGRPAGQHARRGEYDGRLSVHYLLPRQPLGHPDEGGLERAAVREDAPLQLLAEVLRVGGVDGGCLHYHAVYVYRDVEIRLAARHLLQDEHHLLRAADREDRHDDLAPVGGDLLYYLEQPLHAVEAVDGYVVAAAVGALDEQRVQPREVRRRRVEEPGEAELDVS